MGQENPNRGPNIKYKMDGERIRKIWVGGVGVLELDIGDEGGELRC